MKRWFTFGLVIMAILLLWFCKNEPKKEIAKEPIKIVPIVPPITEEIESRLELEKNRILMSRDSPMNLDIELKDKGSIINFVFTPVMPSGTMGIEELHQRISNCVAIVGYELIENPEWVECGGHVRFVFEDQGEIARISLPVCENFMKDFRDWDKAWNYLKNRIDWTNKEFEKE